MKTKLKAPLIAALTFFASFIILIVLVKSVDVARIGDSRTQVGLSGINEKVFSKYGYLKTWHKATNILGYLSLAVAAFFAIYGIVSLIKVKKFNKLDKDFYALAGVYVLLAFFYILFEKAVVNYRPVILDGKLEASFPSSHTMLTLVILGTAIVEIQRKIKNPKTKYALTVILEIIMAVMVIGRLLAGVHWFTDILGGVLISGFMVSAYIFAVNLIDEKSVR